ncbi:AAR domain containing kinase 1 [Plakobranchus ocellatus]|uniref:AAR domain containing kinase 1 n=1 Tax=Plakobranchus ocellatus TaxID=259542 RepID=A0AAV3ZJ84_9GAST|nr:AAR domain containing kinase 1 [Plakobranchus ocellatus]
MRLLTKVGVCASAVAAGTYYAKTSDDINSLGIVRFGRAAYTAAKIAVDYKILFHRIEKTDSRYPEEIHKLHLKSALCLHQLCCDNGGAFIKVGQHIGTLEYLLPMEYVQTMKVLHNEAPQSPLEELKTVIHEDLGQTVEDMFIEFDPEPLGAASLAQVHKAKMVDGKIVAVKIQHPKVKAHSFVDIRTMEFLVHALGWVFPEFDYVWLAEETKKNLPLELDFLNEGRNCEQVGRLLKKFKFLKVPKIYWEYSSERVLTMEYCEGGKVDDVQYMKDNNISVNKITEHLGELYSEMIFVQGYVHCDPHPGNVLVKQTRHGPQLVLLDHGLYQETEFKTMASSYLVEISSVLSRVPRQLLFLFKTNDVVRSIETTLHSRSSSTAFLNMSRCCVRAVADWEASRCRTWRCRLRTELHRQFQLARITLFSLYLWLLDSRLIGGWLQPKLSSFSSSFITS